MTRLTEVTIKISLRWRTARRVPRRTVVVQAAEKPTEVLPPRKIGFRIK